MGGKSLETLETLTNEKATLEVQVTTQQRLLSEMRQELALAKEQRAAAESTSTTQTVQVRLRSLVPTSAGRRRHADTAALRVLRARSQVADLLAQVTALQQSLSDAEARVLQGEAIRRKLHNVIQVGLSTLCSHNLAGTRRPGVLETPHTLCAARDVAVTYVCSRRSSKATSACFAACARPAAPSAAALTTTAPWRSTSRPATTSCRRASCCR